MEEEVVRGEIPLPERDDLTPPTSASPATPSGERTASIVSSANPMSSGGRTGTDTGKRKRAYTTTSAETRNSGAQATVAEALAAKRRKVGGVREEEPVTKKKLPKLKAPQNPSPHSYEHVDFDREYKIRSILKETKTGYFIDWEDDEETGQKYSPTWEPKANANRIAIDDWEARKRTKKNTKREPSPAAPTSAGRAIPRKKGRDRKVLYSSPSSPELTSRKSIQAGSADPEIVESPPQATLEAVSQPPPSEAESPLFVTPDSPEHVARSVTPKYTSPTVEISDPPSSVLAGAYQRLSSSFRPSNGTSAQVELGSQLPETPVDSFPSILYAAAATTLTLAHRSFPLNSGGQELEKVIPDSQSLLEPFIASVRTPGNGAESSFAPLEPPSAAAATRASHQSRPISLSSNDKTNERSNLSQLLVSSASAAAQKQATVEEPVPNQDITSGSDQSELGKQYLSKSGPSQESQVPTPSNDAAAANSDKSSEGQHTATDSLGSHAASRAADPTRQVPLVREVEGEEYSQAEASADDSQPATSFNGTGTGQGSASASPASNSPATASSNGALNGTDRGSTAPQPEASGFNNEASQLQSTASVSGTQSAEFEQSQLHGPSNSTPVRHVASSSQAASISGPAPQQASSRQTRTRLSHLPPTSFQQQQHQHTSPPSDSSSFPFLTQFVRRTHPSPQVLAQPSLNSSIQPAVSGTRNLQGSPSSLARIPPSQPVNIGESAPSRLSTPSAPTRPVTADSRSTMDSRSQTPAPGGLAAILNAIRSGSTKAVPRTTAQRTADRHAAKKAAQKEAESSAAATSTPAPAIKSIPPSALLSITATEVPRSPSVVPAMEAEEPATTEEQNSSERFKTLLPQPQDSSSSGSTQKRNNPTANLPRPDATSTESLPTMRMVPIALTGHQRDQYGNLVKMHRDTVHRFLQTKNPDNELIGAVEVFLGRVRDVTMHPDIDNPEIFTQYETTPSQQADWDVNASAKFRFLRFLLLVATGRHMHIAIACKGDRMLAMLDVFLTGLKIPHVRVSDQETPTADRLRVTLLSTTDQVTLSQPANLVVAIDSTITKEDLQDTGTLAPALNGTPVVVGLLVPGSIEHVEWSLSVGLSASARLRTVVNGIWQLRDEAGRLEDELFSIDNAAEETLVYLASGKKEWNIPAVGVLRDLDSQTDSESDPSGLSATEHSHAQATNKRPLEDAHTTESGATGKKARIEEATTTDIRDNPSLGENEKLPTTINPQDIALTHVSDSITKPTQDGSLTSNEMRLQELLQDTQARLEEYVSALSTLQFDHEEQRTQLFDATRGRDNALLTAQEAITRLAEKNTKMVTLRAEFSELKTQLQDANARLLDHSIPARAELESLRLAAVHAQDAQKKAEGRLRNIKQDLDYAQEMYQTASSSAQALNAEKTDLKSQLANAANRSTAEQAKLRSMGYDAQTFALRDENKRLKALLQNREAGMKFKDEEIARLKESARGRMGMRGGSVPGSPRIGGLATRQGSPAVNVKGKAVAAGMLHPFRNP